MHAQPLITVRSVPASASFYTRLLGAERGHGGDHYEQLLVGADTMILQLHAPEADENHGPLGGDLDALGQGVVLWFETDDFDALLERIASHGIELDREPFENSFARQRECWLHDPDGYQVVIAGPSDWPRHPIQEGVS